MGKWTVEASAEADDVTPDLLADVERAVEWTLERENPREGEFSIALVSDDTIAGLNEEYLSHEGPTDVISFPLGDERRIVGDVYIGLEQAARQAEELGISHSEEILRLTIHGMLHVLGWDHPKEDARGDSPMYRRQEELLKGFLGKATVEK